MERLERRAAKRARVRRERRIAAAGALVLLVLVVVIATAAAGGSRDDPKHPALTAKASHPKPAPIIRGGPIAPARYGGLAALWAPKNVVGDQPGTAAAY